MSDISDMLKEHGLRQIDELGELTISNSFLVDTIRTDSAFSIFPVTKNVHLAYDLLRLYGTHWAYSTDKDWNMTKIGSEEEEVLNALATKKQDHRRAKFCFTQKNLDETQSLWIFVPDTKGWTIYQEQILVRYRADLENYRLRKSEAITTQKRIITPN